MDIKSFGRHIGVPIDSSDDDEKTRNLQIGGNLESLHM